MKLGRTHRRGLGGTLVVGLTAAALTLVGAGTGGVSAKPAAGPGAASTISNDLVEIEPAKVHGSWTDEASGKSGRIIAKFTPEEFVEHDGGVAVEGTLSGVFAGKLPAGQQRQFSEPYTMQVLAGSTPGEATTAGFTSGSASGELLAAGMVQASSHGCDILNLDLGPLDLNLLGLQIDLAPVVLDIVAQPGAGALLGNLLCAVAGLLDPGSGLGDLLGNLLTALNGLLTGLLDVGGALEGLLGGIGGLSQTQNV